MNYIQIKNQGLIDPHAFSLIGASTKRNDDSKIGFFGSGNKYALAYLLRNNVPFKVFSGETELLFTTQKQQFRDEEFDVIYVNGEKTSLTTAMGLTWLPWFIVRELYCNALDEGGEGIEVTADLMPIAGCTAIYVGLTEEFQAVLNDWQNYFSDKRTDLLYFDKDLNKIFTGGKQSVAYRKGIQCDISDNPSIFHYDLSNIAINESRVISSPYSYASLVTQFLQKITDEKIIKRLLSELHMNYDATEYNFYWSHSSDLYSETWLSVIGERELVSAESAGLFEEEIRDTPCLVLPSTMVRGLKDKFGDKVKVMGVFDLNANTIKVLTLTPRQEFILKECTTFFTECQIDIPYPIKVCRFHSTRQLGQAKDKTIYISEKCFEHGKRMVVETIIEEANHIESGFSDETRAFQNHLLRKYVSQIEERYGIFL